MTYKCIQIIVEIDYNNTFEKLNNLIRVERKLKATVTRICRKHERKFVICA